MGNGKSDNPNPHCEARRVHAAILPRNNSFHFRGGGLTNYYVAFLINDYQGSPFWLQRLRGGFGAVGRWGSGLVPPWFPLLNHISVSIANNICY